MKTAGKEEIFATHVFELNPYDFLQAYGAKNVEWLCPPLKVERGKQTNQTKYVVSVQVTDENMLNAGEGKTFLLQPHLGALPAIDQEYVLLDIEKMCGWMPAMGGQGRIDAQYCQFKPH